MPDQSSVWFDAETSPPAFGRLQIFDRLALDPKESPQVFGQVLAPLLVFALGIGALPSQ
jgi:hypothetical protein